MKRLFNVKCVMFNVVLLCTLHFTHYTAFAQPIASDELINNARQYDAGPVVYAGEVIGDIMRRGDFAWINISDGKNAIGVWVEASLIKDIVYAGSYRAGGDRVEVIGRFNRACPEHGGDLDIHASGIKKIASGGLVAEAPDIGKRNVAILLLGTLCLAWILTQLANK